MNRAGHEQAGFFIGTEVEHTPAFGLKTLFVVGIRTIEDIAKNECRGSLGHGTIEHIYFGANQSFDIKDGDWHEWEQMIIPFLKGGYLCTLDIDVKYAEGLAMGPLCEFNNFIPMISVKIPSLQLLGYNATIKLDDKDFAASNPGVWCHSLHDLKDRSKFTDWSKYTKDEVVRLTTASTIL